MARVVMGKRLIEGPATLASTIQALGLQVIDDGAPTSSDLWPIRWVDDSLTNWRIIHWLLPLSGSISDSARNAWFQR